MDSQLAGARSADRVILQHRMRLWTPTGFSLPELSSREPGAVVHLVEAMQLETTYFDSADLALGTAGISLRYRIGQPSGPSWTLITPTQAPDLAESVIRRLTFDGPSDQVPPAALDLLHSHLRSRILLPVARLSALRRSVRLTTHEGVEVATIEHDDITAYRQEETISSFGEIEIRTDRLDRHAAAYVDELIRELLEVHGAHVADASKLFRAFNIRSPRGLPPAPRAPADHAQPTIDDLISSALLTAAGALFANDVGVRLGDDVEALHQFRVAIRKLRSHLAAFARFLVPATVEPLRNQLRWLGGLAGPVRDADVLLERLSDRLGQMSRADTGAAAELLGRLAADRARLHQELKDGMRSERYDLLLDAVARISTSPCLREEADVDIDDAVTVLGATARDRWRTLRRNVEDAGPQADLHQLHQIRIRAKRARYTAEASAFAYGKPARKLARAAEDVQTVLGELQDAVVADQWLRAAAEEDDRTARTAGELIAVEQQEIEQRRRSWPKTWSAISARADKAAEHLPHGAHKH
jgi:CHAD domain-containing protein